MKAISAVTVPNELVSSRTMGIMAALWLIMAVFIWSAFRPVILPSPTEVINAFPALMDDGLMQELAASYSVNFQALLISMALSLGLAYMSVVPVMYPLVQFISKLRFVSPAAMMFTIIALTGSGHQLKLAILTIGISVFFVTTMAGIVAAIPREKFDHARTLRMSEWEIVWYVIIRGTWDQAIDAVRDNAAMGWAMLTMVEGLVRSEGGIGKMILDQDKHLNLDVVYAAAFCIIAVGLLQDFVIGQLKVWLCPYSVTERA